MIKFEMCVQRDRSCVNKKVFGCMSKKDGMGGVDNEGRRVNYNVVAACETELVRKKIKLFATPRCHEKPPTIWRRDG
jgi:hypothetical protein